LDRQTELTAVGGETAADGPSRSSRETGAERGAFPAMNDSREWVVSRTNPEFLEYLSRALRVSRFTAQMLVNRGMSDPAAAARFLNPSPGDLHDPLLLSDMEQAVHRIRRALQRGERIAVYGDYDVDGLTATAVLVETLRLLGAEPLWFIPDRLKHGYGLTREGIDRMSNAGAAVAVTVDCAITAVAEAELAARRGLDLVITDHHHPGVELPPAVAVVNPRRPGDTYPFRELAGVGVAWKLASVLLGPDRADNLLDLVALGTVADVVPLVDEHRWIVRRGIERIEAGLRPGLRALRKAAGAERRSIGASDLAFIFGPRINAAGRLGDAMPVVDLLTTGNEEKAGVLAAFLNRNNQIRQGIEQQVLESAMVRLGEGRAEGPLILSDEGWHPGVLGIVAARLSERIEEPVFLFAEKDGMARGSGRGPDGVHLVDVLERCADLLREFGGHAQAAGVSLEASALPLFRERFGNVYREMRAGLASKPLLRLESAVDFRQLTPGFLRDLSGLEPYGCGNEEPLFGTRGVEVLGVDTTRNNHLRLRMRQNGVALEGIAFSKGSEWRGIREGDRFDVAHTPTEDRWNGRSAVKLRVRGMRPASSG